MFPDAGVLVIADVPIFACSVPVLWAALASSDGWYVTVAVAVFEVADVVVLDEALKLDGYGPEAPLPESDQTIERPASDTASVVLTVAVTVYGAVPAVYALTVLVATPGVTVTAIVVVGSITCTLNVGPL
jgi:hypothetical protein